jgi:hypothetical protein
VKLEVWIFKFKSFLLNFRKNLAGIILISLNYSAKIFLKFCKKKFKFKYVLSISQKTQNTMIEI